MTLLRPECFATRAIWATTGLSIEGEEQDILQKICEENRAGFQEDAVVKATAELQKTRGKSVRTSEWATRDGLLHFGTGFMCQKTRIYGAVLHPNIMTLKLQDMQDVGKLWS